MRCRDASQLRPDNEDDFVTSSVGVHRRYRECAEFDPETPLKLSRLLEKIADCDNDIRRYEVLIAQLQDERRAAQADIECLTHSSNPKRTNQLDYGAEDFDWSSALKVKMRSVFGIKDFRLCQRGVCNANMDGRDIICVMPTGGGKSLTYQLPAILQPGCTLVISPLISLITDQILHLQEAGVQAVKLNSTTPKAESSRIYNRLSAMASRTLTSGEEEIKLIYVTPEKISKSKLFLSLVQRLSDSGHIDRFVIDEAHCVSQLGHDFRPDYEKLRFLRQQFPSVPIMAVTATCPPKVLQDLTTILGLKAVTDGKDANSLGTVYFSSPLYRENLRYRILRKPESAARVLQDMCDYILDYHPNDSGIIYCLTKKDSENVAKGLRERSSGKILVGVYHAERNDNQKEQLHLSWRRGEVKVVCATIAFGLGIDKGDVRFVLHHSISKSVEGYYQESGRAGRDGENSDCLLYYRPQDAASIASMVAHEKEGKEKLHAMLQFAQDLCECRKIQFARYFSHASELAISSWSTEEGDALTACGHCDNCTRSEEEVNRRDVTLPAWQVLKVLDFVVRNGGSLTLKMLATLARGSNNCEFEGISGKKRRGVSSKEQHHINLRAVAGGPVQFSQDDTEYLLVDLVLKHFLRETYRPTAYNTIVYLAIGPFGHRLLRLSKEEVIGCQKDDKLEITFRRAVRIGRKPKPKPEEGHHTNKKNPLPVLSKRKNIFPIQSDDQEDDDDEDGLMKWSNTMISPNKIPLPKRARKSASDSSPSGSSPSRIIHQNGKEFLIVSD